MNPPAGVSYLTSVACPSALDCVAVGVGSPIYTVNGGQTWSVSTSTTASLQSVSCPTVSTCVAVGFSGSNVYSMISTDGGADWTTQSTLSSSMEYLYGVTCTNVSDCVAVGVSTQGWGAVISTTNGGSTWVPATVPASLEPLKAVSCSSSSSCVAVGYVQNSQTDQAEIIASSDGGSTWSSEVAPAVATNLSAVSCTPSACAAAGGNAQGGGLVIANDSLLPPTTTTITSTTSNPQIGQPITLDVRVAGQLTGVVEPAPSGQVTVTDGTQQCEAALAGSNGVATGSCQITEHSAGTYSFSAAYQGDSNFNGSVTASAYSVTLALIEQTISFVTPLSGTVGDSTTLTATGGASGNPVVFSVDPSSGVGVCAVSGLNGSTLDYTGVGDCYVDANQAGTIDYAPATQAVNQIPIGPGSQTISFSPPASGVVGGSATLTAAGGASGNPVVFSVDGATKAGVCAVSGLNGSILDYTGAGTCVVDANQAGNTSYAAANEVVGQIPVGLLGQAISFSAPASGVVGGSATLTATGGGSGNPVVFSVDGATKAGVCAVSGLNGSILDYTGAGTCVVDANQAGDGSYVAATELIAEIAVDPASQAISFAAPASGVVGGSATLTAAGGGSGNPVVFSVDAATKSGVCAVSGSNGSTVRFTGAGTCVVDANQAGDANYSAASEVVGEIVVGPAGQAISFAAPASGVVGGSATLTAAGGGSGNPVVFSVDPSSGLGVCVVSGLNGATVHFSNVGTCVVDANQAGDANYTAASQVVSVIAVGPGGQAISFAAPASGVVGGSATLTAAGGGSGNPVVFSVDAATKSGVCAVSGSNGSTVRFTGAGTCVVDANQAGDANYSAAPRIQRSISVVPPPFTLRRGAATDISVGANGSVWVIGTNAVAGGYRIYRWNGAGWTAVSGGAVSIAVDPSGDPWVITSAHQIFHWNGAGWTYVRGAATAISVGANGSVWVVGTNAVAGGYRIYRWNGAGWTAVSGGAVSIAVDPSGDPWVTNSAHLIYSS